MLPDRHGHRHRNGRSGRESCDLPTATCSQQRDTCIRESCRTGLWAAQWAVFLYCLLVYQNSGRWSCGGGVSLQDWEHVHRLVYPRSHGTVGTGTCTASPVVLRAGRCAFRVSSFERCMLCRRVDCVCRTADERGFKWPRGQERATRQGRGHCWEKRSTWNRGRHGQYTSAYFWDASRCCGSILWI